MELVILGASGFIGSALLTEALARGHQVTAIVSRPERITAQPGLTVLGLDINDTPALASALKGKTAVISAVSGHAHADVAAYYLEAFRSISIAVQQAAAGPLFVVGGAATLLLPDGSRLLDSPDFPPEYRGSAEGAAAALSLLQQQQAFSWSFLSPAAEIFPGAKTGQFRLGLNELLVDAQGRSRISNGDYAVAMLDEVEQQRHLQQRFCVAY